MTEAVIDVEPTAPLTRVLQLMVTLKARSFPVIGPGGQLAGIISREDLMRAYEKQHGNPDKTVDRAAFAFASADAHRAGPAAV